MNDAFNPIILVAVASTIFALISFVFAFRIRKALASSLLGLLGLLLLVPGAVVFYAFYPELVDPRYAKFHEFYNAIEVGMTREQVNETLERIYPPSGPRQRPNLFMETEQKMGFFMDDEGWGYPDIEGVFMDFEYGLVVRKDYSED